MNVGYSGGGLPVFNVVGLCRPQRVLFGHLHIFKGLENATCVFKDLFKP